MKAHWTKLGLLAAIATLAVPSPALAGYLVPPGNSAANQYTETYPTSGGDREVGKGYRSPSEVLGPRNTAKLNAQGSDGRGAARLAAATAPSGGGVAGSANPAEGGDPNAAGIPSRPGTSAAADGRGTADGSGSSAVAEVLGQAAGTSSSGGMGALLPLAILATAAWALVFAWRQRNRPTP